MPTTASTIIYNARVARPGRPPFRGGVLIRGEKIEKVYENSLSSPPPGVKKIDARRGYLTPGLIDLHIHGGGGRHFWDNPTSSLPFILKRLGAFGVTSVLPTMAANSLENTVGLLRYLRKIPRRSGIMTRVLGVNLEGPYLSIGKRGAQSLRYIHAPRREEVETIFSEADGLVKIMTLAPELKGAISLIRYLKKSGVIAAIGHTHADYETTRRALRAGLSYATHFFNSYPPLHHRQPGPLGAILESEEVDVEIIADGIHVAPAMLRLLFRLKDPSRILLVTDGTAALGTRLKHFTMAGRPVEISDHAARLADGTLVGGGLPLNRALKNIMDFTGRDFPSALSHATSYPARVLGISGRKGDLREGMDADLVIWGSNLSVRRTLVGGKTVYHHG